MPSELIKRALKGEEQALVLLTEQIQRGAIAAVDLGDISAIPPKQNKYVDYLKACVYNWGAKIGEFTVPADKYQAVEICTRLIEQDKLVWASNLMSGIVPQNEGYEKYLIPVINSDNPLVLLNYAINERNYANNVVDILMKIYPRLSPYYQDTINQYMQEIVNIRSDFFKNAWHDVYRFYKKTQQHEAAQSVLVIAAENNIMGARMKLYKKFQTPSSAAYFVAGYLGTIKVINRKLVVEIAAMNKQYPKLDPISLQSPIDLQSLLEGLQQVMNMDVTTLKPGSTDHQKYQLYGQFYAFLQIANYIHAKQEEWELFKNYMETHPEILTTKLNHDIAKVDHCFTEYTKLKSELINKMQAIAATQFNFGLYSAKDLTYIQIKILLERVREIRSQPAQPQSPTRPKIDLLEDGQSTLVTTAPEGVLSRLPNDIAF